MGLRGQPQKFLPKQEPQMPVLRRPEGKMSSVGSFEGHVKGTVRLEDRYWLRQRPSLGTTESQSVIEEGIAPVGASLSLWVCLPLPVWSFQYATPPHPATQLATTFSFIPKLNQFGAKHILKCQPTYFVHRMRNARFSENAMFGLDFVLECEMEQMLNPPGVAWRLSEGQSKGDWWARSAVSHHASWWLSIIIINIITIIRLHANHISKLEHVKSGGKKNGSQNTHSRDHIKICLLEKER